MLHIYCNLFSKIRLLAVISLTGLVLLAIIDQITQWQQVIAQSSTTPSPLQGAEITTATNFSTYYNSTYGIKFQFPSNWDKVEVLSGRIIDIGFISPPSTSKNTSDITLPATIHIIIEKGLRNTTTLDQYTKVTDRLLNASGGLNITRVQPTTLGGLSANGRVFHIKQPAAEPDLWVVQVFTIANNKAYIITYSANEAKYFDYLPILQKILSSFQIICGPIIEIPAFLCK